MYFCGVEKSLFCVGMLSSWVNNESCVFYSVLVIEEMGFEVGGLIEFYIIGFKKF